jgi:hypothetical protein
LPCRRSRVRIPSAALSDQALQSLKRCLGGPAGRGAGRQVGEAADRLTGAATLLGGGEVRTRGWTDELDGERVLLIAVAHVTMLALQQAGCHARALGAVEVHGCRVAIAEAGDRVDGAAFDSYCTVTVAESASTRVVLAAAGK